MLYESISAIHIQFAVDRRKAVHRSADEQIIALHNVDVAPGCCYRVVLVKITADCHEESVDESESINPWSSFCDYYHTLQSMQMIKVPSQ